MAHGLPLPFDGFQLADVGALNRYVLGLMERGDDGWLSPWRLNAPAKDLAPRLGGGLLRLAWSQPVEPPSNAPCLMPPDAEEKFLELFAATGMDSRHGGPWTFYTRFEDVIILSDWRESDPVLFLRNWIHELIHATGHPSRLARDLPDVFGPTAHGMEDLVAEIGTSIVCTSFGIAPALRHPDNIGPWLALLRSDERAFGKALSLASAAANYLFALRDAQGAAFDLIEQEEAAAERAEAVRAAAERRLKRQRERERWASGLMTGLQPRESLPAARHGVLSWQSLLSNSS